MSSAGVPQSGLAGVLNLVRPDLAAEQMALQRRQAFAQSLLSQQPQYTGIGGAADNFGSKILGAFLQHSADKQNLDIAKQYRDALFNPQGGGMAPAPAQPQAQPQSGPPLGSLPPQAIPPMPGQTNSGATAQALPPLGSMPSGGLPLPSQGAPMAPQGPLAPQQTMQPQGQRAQSLFDQAVPDIPGVDPRNKYVLYASDPANYIKAYYASKAQPDTVKSALFASGGDNGAAQASIAAQNRKAGTLEFREKGFGVLPNGNIIYGPNEESNTYFTTGPNGEPIAHPIQGGAAVAADQAGQVEHAKELNKVLPDVELSTGAKVPMFAGQATGETQPTSTQPPLGMRSNNPGNIQPGGKEAIYASPQEGIEKMSQLLSGPIYSGKNTVAQIISTYAPPKDSQGRVINNTPAYIADVAARMGVKPNQPLDRNDPETEAMLMHSMIQHENGMQPYQQQKPAQAAPTVGETTAQAEINKASGEAAANSAHIQGSSDALMKAIDGMIAINDQVPDSTVLPPNWKARINEAAPNLPGFRGDSGALHQWEQLNSIGVLGGIKNLGMGRTDIPIVKQVIAGGGIPASVPAADRLRLLQTLKTEVMNNRAAAQNTTANLNNPGAATPAPTPMQTYGQQPVAQHQKIRVYNPKTQRIEDQ